MTEAEETIKIILLEAIDKEDFESVALLFLESYKINNSSAIKTLKTLLECTFIGGQAKGVRECREALQGK